MIQMPRRSVTRFFIPLVDVMTLLFCIFLLMPMVKPSGDAPPPSSQIPYLEAQIWNLQQQVEQLSKKDEAVPDELREKLKNLEQQRDAFLKQNLLVRTLWIDANTGKLYYSDPAGPVEVRSHGEAQDMIRRDRRALGGGPKTIYYLIQYPRDPQSIYPTLEQREQYERWFAGTAYGYDNPKVDPTGGNKS